MTDEGKQAAQDSPKPESTQPAPAKKKTPDELTHIFLVPYPKVVFFYPTFLMSLIAGVAMAFGGESALSPENGLAVGMGTAFLFVFAVNLIVLAFDFPRGTSLTLFFFVVVLVLCGMLFVSKKPDMVPAASSFLTRITPLANATFYFSIAGIFAFIFAIVMVSVRFDYWEIRPNELLHHHGLLSDLKRYSAPNLKIEKEINDVFEYVLLRSGRLILNPSNEDRAIILDNVPFISSKEKKITRLLGALQVQVRRDS